MMSLGAYYAYIVANEMKQHEVARRALPEPKRSVADILRALAAALVRPRARMSARPV
jgi:hypothetical protein